MKIFKVEISKFRSIEKGEFHLKNLNAIVGQNNSGKSALMRALNSFLILKLKFIILLMELTCIHLKELFQELQLTSNQFLINQFIISFQTMVRFVLSRNLIGKEIN